jgi:hypothetical protein
MTAGLYPIVPEMIFSAFAWAYAANRSRAPPVPFQPESVLCALVNGLKKYHPCLRPFLAYGSVNILRAPTSEFVCFADLSDGVSRWALKSSPTLT